MKNRLYIITLLSIVTIVASAQTYGRTYAPRERECDVIQTQRIMTTGANYNGTVYEPFSNVTPSEQSVVGSSNAAEDNNSGRHIRKGLISGPEDPFGPSPIGEPWVLLLCAAVYGVWCIYKRRKRKV